MQRWRGPTPRRDVPPSVTKADRRRPSRAGAGRGRRPRRGSGSSGRGRKIQSLATVRGVRSVRAPVVLGCSRIRGVGRGHRGEKEVDASATIGPQAAGQRSRGRRGSSGDPLSEPGRELVIDDRSRRRASYWRLKVLLGSRKNRLGVASVHDACSRLLIIFRRETTGERTPKTGAEKVGKRP